MKQMRLMRPIAAITISLIGTTLETQATGRGSWKIEGILIEQAWARVQPGGSRNGAIYLTIHNTSLNDELLLAVDSPAARTTAVHKTEIKNGVSRMTPMPFGVELQAGTEVILKPGSMHIMLTGLSTDVKSGGTLPITMVFRDAGTLSAEVPVLGVGQPAPDISHGGHPE